MLWYRQIVARHPGAAVPARLPWELARLWHAVAFLAGGAKSLHAEFIENASLPIAGERLELLRQACLKVQDELVEHEWLWSAWRSGRMVEWGGTLWATPLSAAAGVARQVLHQFCAGMVYGPDPTWNVGWDAVVGFNMTETGRAEGELWSFLKEESGLWVPAPEPLLEMARADLAGMWGRLATGQPLPTLPAPAGKVGSDPGDPDTIRQLRPAVEGLWACWQRLLAGGELPQPPTPTRAWCCQPPNVARWKGEPIQLPPRLWNLLGALLDSDLRVECERIEDMLGLERASKRLANDLSALNGRLLEIEFPWSWRIRACWVLRD